MQHGGVITSPHSSTNLKQLMHISTEVFIEGQTMKVVNTQKRQELFLWTDDRCCFDENLVELGGHMSTNTDSVLFGCYRSDFGCKGCNFYSSQHVP